MADRAHASRRAAFLSQPDGRLELISPRADPLVAPTGGVLFFYLFGKVCAITYARIQGKQAMIQRFQNSSLLAESLEVQPRLFVSHGPDKGKPERFPGGAELPVELPPPVVEPPARRARNRRAR